MKRMILLLLLLATTALAQQADIMFSPFWDFYAENRLAMAAGGCGYAGVAASGDISSTLLNPASLHSDSAWSFSFAYAYKSDLPWLKEIWSDIGFEMYVKTRDPCLLAGVGHRFGNSLQTGIVYYDRFSYRFDMGDLWRTGPNGEDLGRQHSYENVRVSVVSVPVAYRIGPAVTLAAAGDFSLYRHDIVYGNESSTSRFDITTLRIGIIVAPAANLSFGAAYEPPSHKNFTAYGPLFPSGFEPYQAMNKFPLRFSAGCGYRMTQLPAALYADFTYAGMADIDHGLKDRRDVHFGLEYTTSKNIFRAGFFTVQDYRVRQEYLNSADHSQYFITAGITLKTLRLPVTVNIMDSHLLSSGEWKTTMVTVGFNIQR